MAYCIYLRKSRADRELENQGHGDTLKRNRDTLIELAKKKHLVIEEIYEEVVSGDSISARPQMQRLLNDVSEGKWQGVLVMEIERLARGDTSDQGIVTNTFTYSNTLIIRLIILRMSLTRNISSSVCICQEENIRLLKEDCM